MTQPILLIDQVFAVEVPSMAFGFDINNYGDESELMYMLSMEDISDGSDNEESLIVKKLPAGTWKIICTSKEAAGEQLKTIIPPLPAGRKTLYKGLKEGHEFWYNDPLDALHSLLASKNCDQNKNYIILKKVS